ncbi:hypothetical protein Scep_004318 [Stephania cephalantha]|uniref:Uncharacterized protein n=1 Tax=Stephania cephalantha TaxID=152367 RepID=A0AAP0KTW0_9MAGN
MAIMRALVFPSRLFLTCPHGTIFINETSRALYEFQRRREEITQTSLDEAD